MALAFVNTFNAQSATASTFSVTVSGMVAGNILLVGLGMGNTTVGASVTDNANGNYQFFKRQVGTGVGGACEIWVCPCLAGAPTTITATVTNSAKQGIMVAQYSGNVTGNGLVKAAAATASTAATTTITTADANNFVAAFFHNQSVDTWASATGNLRASIAGGSGISGMAWVDNTAAAAGAVVCAATLSASTNWSSVAFEIKTVAPSGVNSLPNSQQMMGIGN